MRIADHLRIVAQARVLRRVGHDEDAALLDGVRAEGDRSRRLAEGHADARLEPLAVLIDERDRRHRRRADVRREQGEIVEGDLGIGIEDLVLAQRLEPFGLAAVGNVVRHHAAGSPEKLAIPSSSESNTLKIPISLVISSRRRLFGVT